MEFKKHRTAIPAFRSSAFLSMSEARLVLAVGVRVHPGRIDSAYRAKRSISLRSRGALRKIEMHCPSRSRRETPKERRSSRGIFPFARRRKHFPSPSPEEGRRRKTRTIATKVANGQSCAKTEDRGGICCCFAQAGESRLVLGEETRGGGAGLLFLQHFSFLLFFLPWIIRSIVPLRVPLRAAKVSRGDKDDLD